MPNIVKVILLFCVFFGHQHLRADQVQLKYYGVNDGLSHSSVFRLSRPDSLGFLWIGTNYGLSRFDGREFENYIFDSPINSNSVLAIYPITHDSFLISYYREGLFTVKGNTFSRLNLSPHPSTTKKLTGITAIARFNHNWWFINGSNLVTANDTQYRYVNLTEPNDFLWVHSLAQTEHFLWVGTSKGLFQIGLDGSVKKISISNNATFQVRDLAVGPSGLIHLATQNGVYVYNEKSKVANRLVTPISNIKNVFFDSKKRLWFSGEDRDIYFSGNTGFEKIRISRGTENVLISDILEDHEGNVWFASQNSGLGRITIIDEITNLKSENYSTNLIQSTYRSENGNLYGGTFGSIYAWSNGHLSLLKAPLQQDELVYAFHSGIDSNELLVGTAQNLMIFRNGLFSRKWEMPGALSFQKSKKGPFYIATYTGTYTATSFESPPQKAPKLPSERTNYVYQSADNKLWLATENGLYYSTADSLTEVAFPIETRIGHIFESSDGTLFFSTHQGLVTKKGSDWNLIRKTQNGKFQANQLISNYCLSTHEDEKGDIWIVTNIGLTMMNKKGVLQAFDLRSRTETQEIISATMLPNNCLLLGTLGSLVIVDLIKLNRNLRPPLPYVKDVLVGNKSYFGSNRFSLSHFENNLKVSFSNIGFNQSDHVVFEYRLNDEAWSLTQNPSVTYKALDHGSYHFQLRAYYEFGRQVSSPIGFNFIIAKPFWKTMGFMVSVVLAIAAILSFIISLRFKRLKNQTQHELSRQKEIANLKHRALNATMNPHFMTNSLYAIKQMAADRQQVEVEKYVSNFSKLVRLNLEQAAHQNVGLDLELDRLKRYVEMEQTRLKSRFSFHIRHEDDLDLEEIQVPNMILQPLVENAIWHGVARRKENGRISVELQTTGPDVLTITIRDNGLGYDNTLQKKRHRPSLGLTMVKEKLTLHNSQNQMTIETLPKSEMGESGTLITITIHLT